MNRITCVVNNTVIPDKGLKGEHGLALWIDTPHGYVLYDTGQSRSVLTHNLKKLGLDAADIDKIVLSHAHYDHTGGLEAVLSKNDRVTLYAHADIFTPRYAFRRGTYESIGIKADRDSLAGRVELNLSSLPVEIIPGLWTSGEIFERGEVEGRSNHHFIHVDDEWQPDPYRDDLSLILKVTKGLVLICGCCHAGLLNTILQVRRNFDEPIIAIIGGTHLGSMDGDTMAHIIDVLKGLFEEQPDYYLNHCSGENAVKVFREAFSGRVENFAVGAELTFD